MTIIKRDDVVQSICDSLQFISYYHPEDYIKSLTAAYEREASKAAKDAMEQILINSRMCAEGHRPICQDTGIVTVFVDVGTSVQFENGFDLTEAINDGVAKAYTDPDNILRASVVTDPMGQRINTKNNTPAIIHYNLISGSEVTINIAAKGGGSEAKTKFAMLNPSDSIVDWVMQKIPEMGAGWCPPGIIGIGVGGTAEEAMLLAKKSLMEPIDIQDLIARGAQNRTEEARIELYEKINGLGIGAQGLGGLTTVLDVKIFDFPTHAANLPIAIIPNCAATRHVEFVLDGKGPAKLTPPNLDVWPKITKTESSGKRVHVDSLTKEEMATWKTGDTLLLSGKILTGRDAAHKRLVDMLNKGEKPPVDFTNRLIYYVGPVDPIKGEAVGPAGPTTATRMDKFTRQVLEQTGLIGMIGKGERGDIAIEAIKDNKAIYLMAIGGAAYLVSKAIKASKVLAFEDLGMEAIYEFTVEDMPVTVAVDSLGNSVHKTEPLKWQAKIGKIPVVSQ